MAESHSVQPMGKVPEPKLQPAPQKIRAYFCGKVHLKVNFLLQGRFPNGALWTAMNLMRKLTAEVPLMRQPRRVAAELPLARFVGTRWIVAMCETDWSKFRHEIASEANERLTVVLESFSEDGEAELPGGSFRWFAPSSSDPVGIEMGAFEARGVVLQGRRAVIDGRDAFFVTDIVVDAPPPEPAKRKRRERDDRQALLPLGYGKSKGNVT